MSVYKSYNFTVKNVCKKGVPFLHGPTHLPPNHQTQSLRIGQSNRSHQSTGTLHQRKVDLKRQTQR